MITVDHLTYTYPNAHKPALCGVSFQVRQGECYGIIGANGMGKSTLCYALMGLVPHFYHGTIKGDVWLDGLNVPDASLADMPTRVGLVFQNPVNQFSGAKLTVEEEIAFGLENLGVPRDIMRERVREAAKTLRIDHVLDRNPYHLSGGQMQRVAIASVFALKPTVLVLDEPTSQLDPLGTAEVFQAIEALLAEGTTVVIVEHKTELLAAHCSRLCVLVDGQIVAEGTPESVFGHLNAANWGVEIPRYSLAYRGVYPETGSVPVTLSEAVERLRQR